MNLWLVLQKILSTRGWGCYIHDDGTAILRYISHLKQQVFYRNVLFSIVVSLRFEKNVTVDKKKLASAKMKNYHIF